jgi:hypothetical protein
MPKRVWTAMVIAITMAVGTGCSGSPSPAQALPTPSSSSPSSPTQGGQALTASVIATFPARSEAGSLTVWPGYIAWSDCDCRGRANEVWLGNLHNRSARIVARPSHAAGQSDWVRGAKNWLIFTDQDRVTTDSVSSSAWRIWAMDVRSGRRQIVGSSTSAAAERLIPTPETDGRYVAWVEYAGPRHGLQLVTYDLERHTVHHFAQSLQATNVAVTGGRVFYLDGPRSHRIIQSVSARGGPSSRLVTTGNVFSVQARGGMLAWEQGPANADTTSVWWMRLTDQHPMLVARRYAYLASPGADFVAWLSRSGGIEARGYAPGSPVVSLAQEVSPFGKLAADGTHLAWVTNSGTTGQSSIEVYEVNVT